MKKILWTSLLSLIIAVLFGLVFIFTPLGVKVLDTALQGFAKDYVSYGSLRGVLARDIEVTHFIVRVPGLEVGADRIRLNWDAKSLLQQKIAVKSLEIDELLFSFVTEEKMSPDPESEVPFVLDLPAELSPFDISLNTLVIKGIGFASDGEMVEHIDHAALSAHVADKELRITKLEVEDEDYGISLSGKAVTGKEWWADISGSWRFSNWDGGELLGSLAAVGPLPDMDVKVELLAPTYVDIVGKMTRLPDNPYFDVVGKGDYTALPVVHPSIPDIRLDALVHATGFVNDYKAELQTTGEYWKFKGITAKGTLWGNFDEIHFPSLQFEHQKTVVDLVGAYLDWDESFIVGGKVIPQHFNPGVMDDRFEGDLTGLIDGKLTVEYGDDGEIYGWYSLQDVEGFLRDYPLKGSIDLRFTDESLNIDKIEMFSGDSQLFYKGGFEDNIDMSIVVKSSDIQELYPDGEGRLDLSASLRGSYENPQLSAHVTGTDIKVMDVRISSIVGAAQNSQSNGDNYRIDLDAKEVSLYGEDARDAHLHFDGSFEKHQGELNLSRRRAALDLRFTGSFTDGSWKAAFSKGKLQHEIFGDWQQQGLGELTIDADHLQLSDFLLKNEEAQLGASGEYSFDEIGEFSFSGMVKNYYLSQIETIIGSADDPYDVSGKLDSSFVIEGNSKQLEKADLRLETETVTIVFPASDIGGKEHIESRKAVLSTVFDGEKVRAHLEADANESTVVSDFTLTWQGQWDADPDMITIQGKSSLNNVTLALLATQTDYLVESRGTVIGDFAFSGSLGKPLIDGDLRLSGGNIFLPEQGIELEQIRVNVQGDGEELLIDGRVFSGGGVIRTKGSLCYDVDRGVFGTITGKGKDFLVLDVPEYTIYASPNVLFSFDRDGMRVEGDVKIPKAKISSARDNIDRVTESEDVTIINVSTGEEKQSYKIGAALKLDLGDNVEFSRFGINGRLAGELDIEVAPTIPLRGNGEVSIVDGNFSAYGRSFEIGRGKVSYAGGPLSNPGLDVRVQKQVRTQTGSAQGIYATVGLDISGYANSLNYTLFSSPYMEDADILSYLLLGHSLFSASDDESNILAEAASSFGWKRGASLISKIAAVLPVDDVHLESGVDEYDMSVIVGKNVTRDLYIGYDYNVLDQLGEILLRYNLKYGFFIESTTSQDSTGADLLYIFER